MVGLSKILLLVRMNAKNAVLKTVMMICLKTKKKYKSSGVMMSDEQAQEEQIQLETCEWLEWEECIEWFNRMQEECGT